MDIDEFEDKNEEVIDEPNLDFDFDDDSEETENVTNDDIINEIPEYHKEFINSGEADKYKDLWIADEVGMTKIGRFFNIEEIPDKYKTVNDNIKDIEGPDGTVVKVIPVATATADSDGPEDMKDYIVLFKYADMYQYGTLQVDPVALFMLARNIDFLRKLYDYWSANQDNVPTNESSGDNLTDETTTDDSSETPEIPEEPNLDEPEATQEGYVMEAFGSTLAKEWIKKPEVIKEINDGIDQQFTSFFPSGIKPSEADLVENRKKILAKNIEPHILMSMYAKKSFDAMLKEEQRLEEEKMRKEMDEMVAKIMGRRNKPTQEAFGFDKLPFSRFYQEADEEESSDDEETMEIAEVPDLDEDEAVEEAPEADTTEDESPDGLEGFGMDTSDVQNEFDPKDIDALNKLIAAESEAINDYFDASKDTRDEDLRTLFSDIGHEERFHLEQLMYAKSKLTGEKYEPRDPEVKAEYEELMNGGMDEETAAYTAMDKRSMLGEDDGDDSDMEELEQESAFITDALYRNEIITSQLTSNIINNPRDISKELGIIVEAFYQEAIDNVSSAPKQYTKIDSPLTLLTKGLKVAVNGLTRMSAVIRDSMRKNKLTRARKSEWIKKHGIMELFKGGIHLYLFDDNKNKMDLDTPCRYVDFLYRLTKAIGESCGVKLTAAAQHKTISNPIKFKNVDEGMYKLSQVIFNKTKVVVTDENKAALQNEFFGYSDEKINVKVTHGTDQVVNDSGNIYNRLDACILVTKKYAEISIAVLDEIKKLEGDVNSVYYKNRTAYNKAMKNIKLVVDKYTQFIGAMSHDLTELMKLDNGLLKMTRERDMTEQGGGKWEGPDIRVNKQASSGTQYTKRKK